MRQLLASGMLILALSGLKTRSALAQSTCHPADGLSAATLDYYKALATTTDSADIAHRTVGGLSPTSASKVSYATDSRTCQRAADAMNSTFQTPGRVRQVYVIKYNTSFVVIDPAQPFEKGGSDAQFVFDKNWVLLHAWVT
jgi:hypothetical protein